MKRSLVVSLAVAGALSTTVARAGEPAVDTRAAGELYVVSHVDVTTEHVAQAIEALREYVRASRAQPGAREVAAVQEQRSNHFNLIEIWSSRAAFEAHEARPSTIRFHDTIAPWRGSPFEERLGVPID